MENNSTDEIKDAPNIPQKPKRKQSEAQKANTQKMREKLIAKHEGIRAEKARIAEEKKKAKEERIVKKAIHIKKKEIKEAEILAISDEEDDDSEIEAKPPPKNLPPPKTLIKKKNLPKKPPTPPSSDYESEEEEYYEAERSVPLEPAPKPARHAANRPTPLQQHLNKNFPFIITYI